MTEADAIKLAKEAGFDIINKETPVICSFVLFMNYSELVRKTEQERCAKLCVSN